MSIGTILCWVAWLFVLTNIAPEDAGTLGLLFFYISLFMSIVGTCSIIGFAIHQRLIKNEDVVLRHVRHTFRQSILIGLFIILTLVLKSNSLLTWWNGLLIAILFVVLEGVLFTKRKFNNVEYV